MTASWFYIINGKEYGPVSARFLLKLAAEGALQPNDMVRKRGMTQSIHAMNVKGLFPQESNVAPIPAEPASSDPGFVPQPMRPTLPLAEMLVFSVFLLGLLSIGTCVYLISGPVRGSIENDDTTTPLPKVGQRCSLVGGLVSTDKDLLQAAIACAQNHDRDAWNKYYETGKIQGADVGSQVTVTEIEFWTGYVKFRPNGSTTDYWTHASNLK